MPIHLSLGDLFLLNISDFQTAIVTLHYSLLNQNIDEILIVSLCFITQNVILLLVVEFITHIYLGIWSCSEGGYAGGWCERGC